MPAAGPEPAVVEETPMSDTVHVANHTWAYVHRAGLAIILLSVALAATLSLLAVQFFTGGADAAPTTSVSTGDLQPVDDGCSVARPGMPC
jgi:hypothetical protein